MSTPIGCITELSQRPEWTDTLVVWHHAEWLATTNHIKLTAEDIEKARRDRFAFMQSHLMDTPIPVTFVFAKEDSPIASASLIYHQPDISNKQIWLTNVFVLPEHRRQGIANQLIQHAIHYCHAQHIKWLQLYTFEATDYYLKRQWEYVSTNQIRGREVDILKINTSLFCKGK